LPDPNAADPAAARIGISKHHVLAQFRREDIQPRFDTIWAVGDNDNDVDMLSQADRAWMIEPKSPRLKTLAGVTEIAHFDELTAALALAMPEETAQADNGQSVGHGS
jgi:glucosyl-3-phosphoglycerate synthase